MSFQSKRISWRFGVVAGILLAVLSLFPQGYLNFSRGENYNGSIFLFDYDEPVYASYIQSLIEGKPRNNSVYLGDVEAQNEETIFSIQFFPPYLLAPPARLLGISAETTFLFVSIIFSFLSGLILFWFIFCVTKSNKFAFFSVLFVLVLGPMAAGISILKGTLGLGPSAFYLTFARRFVPAMAFPFFLALIGFVWSGLTAPDSKRKNRWAIAAGFCFAVLIYSYFFLWTAMLVWLVLICILNLLQDSSNKKINVVHFWLPVFLISGVFFIGYLSLIFNRNRLADESQILEQTRDFVLFRPTLLLGLMILLVVFVLVRGRYLKINEKSLFVISFSALPLFVFNQQVISGISLQPLHYNMYVLNYLILVSIVILVFSLFGKSLERLPLAVWYLLAGMVLSWGLVEMHYTTVNRYWYNSRRDEARPVNLRLAEISKETETGMGYPTTFGFDGIQVNNQATLAPMGVLWSEHLFFLSNISAEEHRRRYYFYIYFHNRDSAWLERSLSFCPNEACRALIGWKVNRTLWINPVKVGDEDIEELVAEYAQFIASIDRKEVKDLKISYVIASKDKNEGFGNFDRWYERETPESHGNFLLYSVRLKN